MSSNTFGHDFPGDVVEQNRFSLREVGITHPDLPSHVRLCDDGSVEIYADEGIAIILNPHSRSITFMADHIKFVTRRDGGLRWNNVVFNEHATAFNQPAFLPRETIDTAVGMYHGADYFADDVARGDDLVTDPHTGMRITHDEYQKRYGVKQVWDPDKGFTHVVQEQEEE